MNKKTLELLEKLIDQHIWFYKDGNTTEFDNKRLQAMKRLRSQLLEEDIEDYYKGYNDALRDRVQHYVLTKKQGCADLECECHILEQEPTIRKNQIVENPTKSNCVQVQASGACKEGDHETLVRGLKEAQSTLDSYLEGNHKTSNK